MHGHLCAIADGPTDLCCNECPLLAGHIEIVGCRSDATADDADEASRRVTHYREMFAWAASNGWHRTTAAAWSRSMGAYTIGLRWMRDGGSGSIRIGRINHSGPARMELLFRHDRVRDIAQGVDLLVALGFLPSQFSSAYRAGVTHGQEISEALAEQVIEDSVTNQMDLLLARLADADGMRTLGDLLDRHPRTEGLLSSIPYIRRNEIEAIAETVGELMGVGNAS